MVGKWQKCKIMNKRFIYSILAVFAVCGCQVMEGGETAPASFTATIEDSTLENTRTSLNSGGHVLWKMGDQLNIFAGSFFSDQYQVSDDSDGKIDATLNLVSGSGTVSNDIENNVAFYPYADKAALTNYGNMYGISNITLPATQYYAEKSFGNGAFPMVAVTSSTSDKDLKFKNVLGGLKLQLKGTAKIVSMSIYGKNDEILCGTAEVYAANGMEPLIYLSDATAKTVTLDCGAGVQLNTETAVSFIIALPPVSMDGGFTVIVNDSDGKHMELTTNKTQIITRSSLLKMPEVTYAETATPDLPATEMVDLGLSVKWASFNVGATKPEEYGHYFAWGETEPKTDYSWATYKWCNGDYNKLTKYNNQYSYGTADGKKVLESGDDAATVKWGEPWRTPTSSEWEELAEDCIWQWKTYQGVKGYLVSGKKSGYTDKSIFLPAAGAYSESIGVEGLYWSANINTSMPFYAIYSILSSNGVDFNSTARNLGLTVRPVHP